MKYYSVDKALEKLKEMGIEIKGRDTILRAIRAGELKAIRVGRPYSIKEEELFKWIDGMSK